LNSRDSAEKEGAEGIRLDKWLWAARFFKTRQLATDAINGGKVHLNGQRVKPGKEIAPGARLAIRKEQYEWDIVVAAVSRQRRPASESARLYEETPESHARRQALVLQRREEKELFGDTGHRPNKKERRQIHRFKQGG
jgi:ribosome-associated heat shock protein Hsp15